MDEKGWVVVVLVFAALWFSPWFRVGAKWGAAVLFVLAVCVIIVNPSILDLIS